LQNASLTDVVEVLARRLKISYILDPRVKGSVNMNTYGPLREVDIRALLDIILRANGAAIVQVGEIYRVVPLAEISRQPLRPEIDPASIPEDERMSLNLVFLKYAAVSELSKLLEKFLGEGATMVTYEPANLMLLMDNNRNMKRTMDLISLFDSDVLARQRVRLYETKNGRPSDIAKELETILRGASLGDKATAVRFMPIDRINTLVAVAPNPGVFAEVDEWLRKIDIPVKVTAGSVDNYVYRVKYGRAETLAHAIMALYLGYSYGGYGGGGMGGYGMGGYGMGGYGMGGYGMGGSDFGFGGRLGSLGGYGGGYGGYGGGYGGGWDVGYGGGGYGGYPGTGYGYGRGGGRLGYSSRAMVAPPAPSQTEGGTGTQQRQAGIPDQTGTYLGDYGYGYEPYFRAPRVVPNPLDNSLLIQATAQEYEQITKLLNDLDLPPRQVLIEAKIYEVSLTGAFAGGVNAYLQRLGASGTGTVSFGTRLPQGTNSSAGARLTAGMLIGKSRELLGVLTIAEDRRQAKIISAPSVMATDSIPASINVGQDVPVLTSQALTGAQVSGSSLFANTIQSRSSGVTLQIVARVNPSGIVTLLINQEVSAPVAPSANAAIQSPSFTTRSVQTQVTVEDGDTIAIGGIIQETDTKSTAGFPVLHRIPILGMAFGAKSTSTERTELVVFMTPRVIYDTNLVTEASEELKSRFKRLSNLFRE
jgi:general secretion pathway protein D